MLSGKQVGPAMSSADQLSQGAARELRSLELKHKQTCDAPYVTDRFYKMIPERVDCIIIGTGLTNSIIAAACSRVGKAVLHIDKNPYYGGEWASFTFQQLLDWIRTNEPSSKSLEDLPEDLTKRSRMFCIDLCPRLLFSDGKMVELLVKSNVARYHEFKNNIRILSLVNDELHVMPCRRSDVFTSSLIDGLIDKRRLMKFIEMCMKFNPDQEQEDTRDLSSNLSEPINRFLKQQGLKPNLCEYIINSIAMVDPEDTVSAACDAIKKFMFATERYGRSPFIFPLYGCGEYPQSFCRLSAVFGGVYCLNTLIDSIVKEDSEENDDRFRIKFNNHEQSIRCQYLVTDHCNLDQVKPIQIAAEQHKLSRAIIITDRSIVENDDSLLSFLRIPKRESKNENLVYLLELNSSIMVCPTGINIIYLWTKSSNDDAYEDLKCIVEKHIPQNTVKWSYFYQQLSQIQCENETIGLFSTDPPCEDLDYSGCIQEAEKVFFSMFPDLEFLPRAPDPDEIVTSTPDDAQ